MNIVLGIVFISMHTRENNTYLNFNGHKKNIGTTTNVFGSCTSGSTNV